MGTKFTRRRFLKALSAGATYLALKWALKNRPSPEEAKAYVCRFRADAIRPAGTGRVGRGPVPQRAGGEQSAPS